MSGSVLFETDDEITETTLAQAFGRVGNSDYVASGVEFDPDFANDVLDISAGIVYILEDGRDYTTFPDAAAGLDLPSDGIAHVFIAYDRSVSPEPERLYYVVEPTDTPPTVPSLKVGTVDMAAESYTELNRSPPVNDEDALTYKSNDIDSDGDGVVDESDSTNYVAGADVDGAVTRASGADALGTSLSAGTAALVGAPTDHQGYGVENVHTLLHRTGGDDVGLRLASQTAAESNIGTAFTRLVPVDADGNTLNDNDLIYRFSENRWVFEPPIEVENGPVNLPGAVRMTTSGGSGVRSRFFTASETASGTAQLRLTPFIEGSVLTDKELVYDNGSNEWGFDTPVSADGSTVLRRADESGLDVATARTADVSKKSTNSERRRQVIRSPNLHVPIVELDPDESVESAAIPLSSYALEVMVWGVQTQARGTDPDLVLRVYDENDTSQGSTTDAREAGDPASGDGQVAQADGNKAYFKLDNETGNVVEAGFYVGYYLV